MTGISCRVLTDRLVGLGVVTPERAETALRECAKWAPDLDEEQELADLVTVFEEIGIAVYIHGKVDDLEDAYRSFLEEAAACSGGAVTVDGVELGNEVLHFRRNGRPHRWNLEHLSHRYLDVLTMWEHIGDLAPDKPDPRAFFQVIEDEEEGAIGWYLLLTADQARALREELGLPLDEKGHEGPPAPSTAQAQR